MALAAPSDLGPRTSDLGPRTSDLEPNPSNFDGNRSEFSVTGQLRTGGGEALLRLTDRYAVSVFLYVDAPTGHFGQVLDPGARRALEE
ncbi:hypothetical protein ACIBRY_11270 [Streptomyces anulatus]